MAPNDLRSASTRPSLLTPVLFVTALVLTGAALVVLGRYPDRVWDGFVLATGAVLAFAGTLRSLTQTTAHMGDTRRSIPTVAWQAVSDHPWRGMAFLAALGLIVYVLRRLPLMPPTATYTAIVWAWVFAFILYVLAVAPPNPRPRQDWSIWWEINRSKVVALTGIVVLALVLRVWHIGSIPFVLSGDEASQGLEALRVVRGEIRNPFSTGWLSVPTMSFYFNSITLRVFGRGIAPLRLPWALVGTSTVLLTFWLVTRLKGVHLGFASAALLALYHYHIHFSRLGSNQIADPFFAALALLFLYRALDRRSPLDWTLLGGVTGFSLYFYAGARFVPVLVITVLVYLLLCDRRDFWEQHRVGMLMAVGAFFVVAAPMIQYALRYPDDFSARINQVGIIQSGWLMRETEIRGSSVVAILFDQFQRAALAFNYYPDRTVWYGLDRPLLDPLFGGLFLIGLGYGTVRAFFVHPDRRLVPIVLWWWGGMIAGGVLTESPPSSQRLVTLSVPVCFFIAFVLWRLIRLADETVPAYSVPTYTLLGAGVALFGLVSLYTYFGDTMPDRRYGGTHAEFATELAPTLREHGNSHDVYFVGAPWMYWEFATLPYLAPNVRAQDVTEPVQTVLSPDLVAPGRGALFVFVPERESELESVRAAFPTGQTQRIRSPVDDRLLGLVYLIPPEP